MKFSKNAGRPRSTSTASRLVSLVGHAEQCQSSVIVGGKRTPEYENHAHNRFTPTALLYKLVADPLLLRQIGAEVLHHLSELVQEIDLIVQHVLQLHRVVIHIVVHVDGHAQQILVRDRLLLHLVEQLLVGIQNLLFGLLQMRDRLVECVKIII